MSLLVDSSCKPFVDLPACGRARADSGSIVPNNMRVSNSSLFPYDAASYQKQEMGDWYPWVRSPDSEINVSRDIMVSRSRDLARNDGWASGGITRILDNTIGAHMRLSANPDYRALAMFEKAFDVTW